MPQAIIDHLIINSPFELGEGPHDGEHEPRHRRCLVGENRVICSINLLP